MTFQPLLPTGGLAGWRFLQRTYESQLDSFSQTSPLQRSSMAFSEKIGSISSAEDLVGNRQLLSVALGAFGLQDDIDNSYFIRKVLEDGVTASDSLANKLADGRYKEFSQAFGFGPGEILQTGNKTAMSRIVNAYFENAFEVSVGEQDENLRVALYARRELMEIASGSQSEDTKWFTVMSLPALRSMFETALGLPESFSQIDIDKQLDIFREKTLSAIGHETIGQFSDSNSIGRLTDLFLARAQILELTSSYSAASTALLLLQS